MLLGVLGSSCGADTRSFALALVTHETARPMAIARPIPPINLRVDVRLPRPAARAHAPVARVDDAAASERYREWSLDELADAMSTRSVRRVLGNYRSTSPIYRLELEGGVQVGFRAGDPGSIDLVAARRGGISTRESARHRRSRSARDCAAGAGRSARRNRFARRAHRDARRSRGGRRRGDLLAAGAARDVPRRTESSRAMATVARCARADAGRRRCGARGGDLVGHRVRLSAGERRSLERREHWRRRKRPSRVPPTTTSAGSPRRWKTSPGAKRRSAARSDSRVRW